MNDSLEAGVRVGDFRIEKRLGGGGMGIVYLATQVSLDRPVALKVLGRALDRDADIARFQREAQAVARLNHPGIAGVHFVGQDGQVCFMAMEFVDGVSLRTLIDRLAAAWDAGLTIESAARTEPPGGAGAPALRFDDPTQTYVPADAEGDARVGRETLTSEAARLIATREYHRRCCGIVREAAAALAHAHERGVVHRDVKPENVMVDRGLHAHVIDFGIARFFEDATLTATGSLVGTPMYMSPEQVSGRLDVDHRTDVYSLGLVLYELLTLRRPITDATREGVLRRIVTKPLVPVSWRNRVVGGDLEAVVHKAAARDPDERYQSAAEFAADLQRWLDGRPVAATPYRYRFDEREVLAARPPGVVLAATWVLFGSLYTLLTALQRLWVGASLGGLRGAAPADLAAVLVGVVYFVTSRGLLRGRPWSRWLGAGLGVLNVGLFAGLIYLVSIRSGKLAGSYWFSMFVMVLACWSATLVILLRRRTGEWFRLARRLRAEHEWQATSAS
jgi:tRNA A-37 threonylcarbamoyl transferase component Bud32